MRLRRGSPDLARYADRFDVPVPHDDADGLTVSFLGVATLLVDDGRTAVLTDGFFSRPSLLRVGLGRLRPDAGRIEAALRRAGVSRLAAVAAVHSHFDHAMDVAEVARRTGAVVVGGASTAHVARGGGLAGERVTVVRDGDAVRLGAFTLTFVASAHCPPDRYPGAITEPVVPPVRASAYRCGEAWSVVIEHAGRRRLLVQGSAGYVEGALAHQRADVAYLGVGQLGLRDEGYLRAYWEHTVRAVGARRVVLIHWDDMFRPLDPPWRALPYAGDDLDVSLRVLDELAARDGVRVHLPTPWRREDPFAGP